MGKGRREKMMRLLGRVEGFGQANKIILGTRLAHKTRIQNYIVLIENTLMRPFLDKNYIVSGTYALRKEEKLVGLSTKSQEVDDFGIREQWLF